MSTGTGTSYAPPQPQKEDTYTSSANPVSKQPPEQACSDTPLSSDPYGSGDNCVAFGKAPSPQPQPREWAGGRSGSNSPVPSALERGVRKGQGHPLRQAEGVDYDDDLKGDDDATGADGGDAQQTKMAPPAEGKVAQAVEGQREEARRRRQQQEGAAHYQTSEGRGESGSYEEVLGDTGARKEGGSSSFSGSRTSGKRHGRIRGEVSLGEAEGELERYGFLVSPPSFSLFRSSLITHFVCWISIPTQGQVPARMLAI